MRALKYLVNLFRYFCHLETMRHCSEYEPYDFSRDWA